MSEDEIATIRFTLPFVKGLQRARMTAAHGHARQYDSPANRANKALIQALYRDASQAKYGSVLKARRGNPVSVCVTAFEPMPKSRPKRVLLEPFVVKPDIDNICKLVLDALNGVAYVDDAQVTDLNASKRHRSRESDEPYTIVTLIFQREVASE